MARLHLHTVIGLAGVADDEREAAQRWGRKFELPMLLMAFWIVVEWYVEANGQFPAELSIITDWVVWLLFVIETSVLCYLVQDKQRYLRSNWINIIIILMGIPIIWGITTYAGALRTLRLLLMLALLLHISDTVRQVLARNHLGITLMVAFVLIIMSGVLIAGIDPAIGTLWEGIWWAWVTVTTVGYGDIVPSSGAGKLFGALLILLGVGLFSLLTAGFSAFFISRDEKMSAGQESDTLAKLEQIEKQLARLQQAFDSDRDKTKTALR